VPGSGTLTRWLLANDLVDALVFLFLLAGSKVFAVFACELIDANAFDIEDVVLFYGGFFDVAFAVELFLCGDGVIEVLAAKRLRSSLILLYVVHERSDVRNGFGF